MHFSDTLLKQPLNEGTRRAAEDANVEIDMGIKAFHLELGLRKASVDRFYSYPLNYVPKIERGDSSRNTEMAGTRKNIENALPRLPQKTLVEYPRNPERFGIWEKKLSAKCSSDYELWPPMEQG